MTLHLMGRARIFHPPHSQHFFLCHRFQLIEAISMAQPNIGQVSTHRSLTFTLWSSHHGCQMHPTVGRAPEIASSWLYISVLVHVTIFGTAREKEPPNKIPAKINDRRIKSKYARAMWRKQWDLCRCCGCCCCCAWESEEAKKRREKNTSSFIMTGREMVLWDKMWSARMLFPSFLFKHLFHSENGKKVEHKSHSLV